MSLPIFDKLCRAVLDGLGQSIDGKSGDGRLWVDDSIVVELIARKHYDDECESGAKITITKVETQALL